MLRPLGCLIIMQTILRIKIETQRKLNVMVLIFSNLIEFTSQYATFYFQRVTLFEYSSHSVIIAQISMFHLTNLSWKQCILNFVLQQLHFFLGTYNAIGFQNIPINSYIALIILLIMYLSYNK